ncbi:hypothetical protein [Streptomyces sp. JHA26]|uniref:hypothetical protein n=1 Tax=Streptomyces sp. JHA26 TaxID=1917143 RepID=UPI00098B130D|nr:hypothetical protein [Streptomyces sp. JHA26]
MSDGRVIFTEHGPITGTDPGTRKGIAHSGGGTCGVVTVAVLLLPGLGLLLFTMTWLEDRLLRDTEPARHARRRRHLRLLPGGRSGAGADRGRAPAGRPPASAGRDAA